MGQEVEVHAVAVDMEREVVVAQAAVMEQEDKLSHFSSSHYESITTPPVTGGVLPRKLLRDS